MTENGSTPRIRIPLGRFLDDLRSKLTDHELREKYNLSARGFVSLIKALLSKGIITEDDLRIRKEMAVQRDLAKESEFLAQLYICPNCSHPHPVPFTQCPACGVDPSTFQRPETIIEPGFTTTGGHFYVEGEEVEELEVTGDYETVGSSENRSEETRDSAPATSIPAEKKSSLEQIRSFWSKFRKK